MQARLDSSARDQHIVEIMALKKNNMNKFCVIKDILAICGPYFSEETRNDWMNNLIDRGTDILDDLYSIQKAAATDEGNAPISTTSTTSSSIQTGVNLNQQRTPNFKSTYVPEGKAISSNKSSSSTSSSSSNVVSQSQSARIVIPSGPSSKSYNTSDLTSTVQKSQPSSKAPPSIKPTAVKSNSNSVVPGSNTTFCISNAELEIDEQLNPMDRPTKRGKS